MVDESQSEHPDSVPRSASLFQESGFLAKQSLIYSLGQFTNQLVAFLLLPVYTRYLTPYDYGIKELLGLAMDVLGILLAVSIASAVFRFYFDTDVPEERRTVVSTAFLSIGAIALACLVPLSFAAPKLAQWVLDGPELAHFVLIALASLWFQSVNNIAFNYMRANQQSVRFVAISVARLLLTIGANIVLVCVYRLGVLGILVSTLITSVATFAVVVVPLLRSIGLRFSSSKCVEMLKFGLPLIPSQLGAFCVHVSDRFFLKEYCSIADAGLYSLAYRFGSLPNYFVAGPFNQTWQPRRYELCKQPDSQRLFGRIFTYYVAILAFVGLGITLLTRDVLRVIAAESFWEAHRIVPILVLASIIFSLHYHLNFGILLRKRTKYLAYVNFSNGVLILGLNFLLIPRYGVYGAAWATLVAFVYKVTLTHLLSRKLFAIQFEGRRLTKITLAVMALYGAGVWLDPANLLASICVKLTLLFAYPLCLSWLGFFAASEKQRAWEAWRSVRRRLRRDSSRPSRS